MSGHTNLQKDHCSLIANALMMVGGITETCATMSFTSFSLTVIFIIRLWFTKIRIS